MKTRTQYFFPKGEIVAGTYLTPIGITHKGQNLMYECRCVCGNLTTVAPSNLAHAEIKSCGCKKSELTTKRLTTHGLSTTQEYFAAWSAFDRCHNVKSNGYYLYGARGIKCIFKDVPTMARYLIEKMPRPKGKFLLDRKDNDGNYERGNLRWATPKESGRNRRGNHLLEISGVTKTIAEWSEISGVEWQTLRSRVETKIPQELWLFKGKLTKSVLWEREYSKTA